MKLFCHLSRIQLLGTAVGDTELLLFCNKHNPIQPVLFSSKLTKWKLTRSQMESRLNLVKSVGFHF